MRKVIINISFFILLLTFIFIGGYRREMESNFNTNESEFVVWTSQNRALDSKNRSFDSKSHILDPKDLALLNEILESKNAQKIIPKDYPIELRNAKDSRILTNNSLFKIIPNPEPSAHSSAIVIIDSNIKQGKTWQKSKNTRSNFLSLNPKNTQENIITESSPKLMALFFAGTREGDRDVKIYQSFLEPLASPKWSEPRAILTREDMQRLTGKYFRKLGNPIVFKDINNKIHCFIVGVSLGGWATSKVYQFHFDEHYNLIYDDELHLSPLANISYLIRTPAVALKNGGFMLPLAHETWIKYPLIAFFDKHGKMKFVKKINNLKNQLQPSIVATSPHTCVTFMRSYLTSQNPPGYFQKCDDNGNTWEEPKESNLNNYDSSSVLVTFKNTSNNDKTEVLLAHNNKTRKNLSLYYLDDSKDNMSQNYEKNSKQTKRDSKKDSKTPTFKELFIIDLQDGEVSYPAMYVDDTYLHMTYTFKRKNIKYVRIKLNVIQKLIEIIRKS